MSFEKAFLRLLNEQDPDVPAQAKDVIAEPKPDNDREAMAQKLDTAEPKDFDVKGGVTNIDHLKKEQQQKLGDWIAKIDEFIEFLNSPNETSIQTQLHAARCDTIFEDIARSEKKKIARLAAELSSLSESFKGYLISSND